VKGHGESKGKKWEGGTSSRGEGGAGGKVGACGLGGYPHFPPHPFHQVRGWMNMSG
jgi:hypothetical protein